MRYYILDVISAIKTSLTNDLRRAKYRNLSNQLAGHCYVATEALYHILGGKRHGLKPMFIRHEGQPHWFLQSIDGGIYDITYNQFDEPIKYEDARGKGFLTKRPSKRAKIVIKRAKAILEKLVDTNM